MPWDDAAGIMAHPFPVLVADAHPSIAEGLALALAQDDELRVTGYVTALRELLAQESFDGVVIFELALAGNGGFNAVRLIRSRCPNIRVLVFTGMYSEKLVLEALGAGAHGYLSKAERLNTLIRAIKAVSRSEIWAPRRLLSRVLEDAYSKMGGQSDDSEVLALTAREREICDYIGTGRSNKQIAALLSVSEGTVKSHLNHIFHKLHVHRRLELAAKWGQSRATRE
ncbi:MAG: response regulator transcription factor [Gammaproteobacteria bacterium]|nr:response regulator transcription factor [Gammaproteobacteria bacterium]NIR84742.1 response regulator transcription factor [Gammaproteobacteria bacterium]NIR91238.1 response regulator transcription factor [Gammaproteobacteria bacterium]NIU05785.1 response regulator transcription factor [Gammaproteobacteria bacterium]NIV52904.1 response regulator [Gammaproteobacteria bacterium]